jgi:hypothetical protein
MSTESDWRPGTLWISWNCHDPESRRSLQAERRLIPPAAWERFPDGGGMFNRLMIPVPAAVVEAKPMLRGYTIHTAEVGGEDLFLPLEGIQRFEETFHYLPPGALQVMELGPTCQPLWRVWNSTRNPYPRWERRLTLYGTRADTLGQPASNVFFDAYGRICATEVLQTDGSWKIGNTGFSVQRQQSTRLWVAFLS